ELISILIRQREQTQQTSHLRGQPILAPDSHRKAISRRNGRETTLAIRVEGETRLEVLSRQIGKVLKNLGLRHSRTHIVKDIVNSNAKAPNTRLSAHLARFDDEPVAIVHSVLFDYNEC